MNCATHPNQKLQEGHTQSGILVCPRCWRERQEYTIEIPWQGIKISELCIFDNLEIDGDRKVVIVRERL